MRKTSLDALTGARFFAALYVLALHCFMTSRAVTADAVVRLPWPITNFLDRGCMAVGFFFVLSGFILAYNYSSQGGGMVCTKHDFWVARFARIWPMFMIGLLFALPLFYNTFHNPQADPMHAVERAIVHLLGNAVLLNAWFAWLNDINGPGWSLSAEAFFYLVFPFALAWLGKLSNRRLLRAGVVFYLISLLPPLLYCWHRPCSTHLYELWVMTPREWATTIQLNVLPIYRLPEFLMGVVMGIVYNRTPTAMRNAITSNSGLAAAVLLAALAFTMEVPWPVLRNGFFAPLCAWLIWALAREHDGILYRLLASKTCVLLGEASYGFYLFHYPISHYVSSFLVHEGLQPTITFMVVRFVVSFALVTPLSIFLFLTVEEPARKFLRRELTSDRGFLRSLRRM